MKTLKRTLLCIMMLTLLMPFDGFAQKNRGKGKARTEKVSREQKRKSPSKAEEKNDKGKIDESVLMELLTTYVESRVQKQDASQALIGLNDFYKSQVKTAGEKNAFLQIIYDALKDCQKNQKDIESLAIVEVYQYFADKNDSRLPVLYYVRGEINALVLKDSTALKESILDLTALDNKRFLKKQEYIDKLQGFLKDIREYVPVTQRLGDDIWISAGYPAGRNGYPKYILKVDNNGRVRLQVSGNAATGGLYINDGDDGAYVAQSNIDLGNDCAYLNWSNEILKVPSDSEIRSSYDLASGIGGLTGSVISEGFGTSALGDFAGGILSSILGNVLRPDDPKKYVYIWEATIHKLNSYMIQAKMHTQKITINSYGIPIYDNNDYNILFLRLSPVMAKANNISFFDYEYFKKLNDKDLKKMMKDSPNNCGLENWNALQMARLYDACEKEVIAAGESLDDILVENKLFNCRKTMDWWEPVFGEAIDKNPRLKKKYKDTKGVFFEKINYDIPGLYGMKNKDVILSIDDYEMNSLDEIDHYIRSLDRLSPVNIKVLRGKKVIDIKVPQIGLSVDWHPGLQKKIDDMKKTMNNPQIENDIIGSYQYSQLLWSNSKNRNKDYGTLTLNADHTATRKGIVETTTYVEGDSWCATYTYNFSGTWQLEGGLLVESYNETNVEFSSFSSEGSDFLGLTKGAYKSNRTTNWIKRQLTGDNTYVITKFTSNEMGLYSKGRRNEATYTRQ